MDQQGGDNTRWHAFDDGVALAQAAAVCIGSAARDSIAARDQFHIVLAGGDTPRGAYRQLVPLATDWSRWHVWFGDERCLPVGAAERNAQMARDSLLDRVAIPINQIHSIPAERGPVTGARIYADQLRGIGLFDVVLLGLGEDGHTASLFPGHDWGRQADAADALAVEDAPKPPPQRVSLSAARLSRARAVLFLVQGASKCAALVRWRAGEDIPARAIMPPPGVDVLLADCNLPK